MVAGIQKFEDGTAAFFSNRIPAWHTLGIVTDGAQTAEEALKIAYLDWEVFKSKNPIGVEVPNQVGNKSSEILLKDKFLTYRYHPKTGTPQALGVVGNRWTPVQNIEAFEFLNDITDESGAVFETAGALGNGEKVFMTMKLPESILIGGVDVVNMNLLAWNTHDGSSSFNVVVTPIRVVCQNTLAMAIANNKGTFTARHTSNVAGKIQIARETLGMTFKYVKGFEEEAETLYRQSFTDKKFRELVETLVPISTDTARAESLAINTREEMFSLWKAPTQENIAGTKWAAYNAIVEYSDWAKPVRSSNQAVARATRTIIGQQDSFKNKALALLS